MPKPTVTRLSPTTWHVNGSVVASAVLIGESENSPNFDNVVKTILRDVYNLATPAQRKAAGVQAIPKSPAVK